MKQVYLTLIAVVRDQEHYIKEWLAFHRITGIERFVLVLHKCRDKTEERIREMPFIDSIYIHHIADDTVSSVQLGAYHWAVQHYGHHSRWVLFLDTDEFMFGTEEDFLPDILRRYENYGGLAVHLHHFGSNNCVVRPSGLSIESFIERKADSFWANRSVKSFIQMKSLIAVLSPHVQITSVPVVRERFDLLGDTHWGTAARPVFDIIRCNHYHTRSMEDWVERRRRGSCNTFHKDNALYDVKRFIERNTDEMVIDKTILRFSDRVREVLQ